MLEVPVAIGVKGIILFNMKTGTMYDEEGDTKWMIWKENWFMKYTVSY